MSGYRQFCGLAVALDVVGDRWNLLIVRELLAGPRRFGELRSNLVGAASNLVTARLRALEASGIVARESAPERKAVTYSLTPIGEGLREPVYALVRWGAQFMSAGPGDDDIVRGEWIGLAASALLTSPAPTEVDTAAASDGMLRLTVTTSDERVATVVGPPAALLGVVAGALPPGRSAALGVSIDDADGVLPAPTRATP